MRDRAPDRRGTGPAQPSKHRHRGHAACHAPRRSAGVAALSRLPRRTTAARRRSDRPESDAPRRARGSRTLGPRAARPYTTVSAALARTPHLSGLTQCRGLCESGTAGAASQPALWLAPKPTVAGFVAGARPRPRPRSPLATPRSRRTRTTAPLNYSGRIDAPSSRRGSAYP